MSKEDWVKAAEKYKEAPPLPLTPEQEESVKRHQRWEKARHDLDHFIHHEEGRAAMYLLKAAKKEIVFYEDVDESGRAIRFFDENGYRSLFIPTGSRYGCSQEAPAGLMIDSRKMDKILRSPQGIMGWLRHQLDAIAREAPEP